MAHSTDRENPLTSQCIDPKALPRERARHYIAGTDEEIAEMLEAVGANRLGDLFSSIEASMRFRSAPALPDELEYDAVRERMLALSQKNRIRTSFIGDGLPHWSVDPIVPFVSGIRNLATSYTPYQPERSQGTLISHWIYQCAMAMLTGFEAINSSLYDRSTALFEAICCSVRLLRNTDTAIVPDALYPGDLEVLETLAEDTPIRLLRIPLDPKTGTISRKALEETAAEAGDGLAAVVFPQVNTLGLLEDVDALTDFCTGRKVKSIAVIDPMLLAAGGLKRPADFGSKGADMIVGEGQHLAIAPNFGGPGLGIFGVRHNDEVKQDIRQTPGRFVGKARDLAGRDCRVMVLSTREQHIRKDKATSNICSNQAFLATLAGASLLAKGEEGLRHRVQVAQELARDAAGRLKRIPGVSLAYPGTAFCNEVTLAVPGPVSQLLKLGRDADLHLGVEVSDRIHTDRQLLKISFSDVHGREEIERLISVFSAAYGEEEPGADPTVPVISESLRRTEEVGFPQLDRDVLRAYYRELGELNVGPEQGLFPLGSCTMKYNPYLNEWAAALPGFCNIHPQAPIEDAQGCLEVIYETQEWFKGITGLAAVTTQPVAGAQGELVGLKLFQAYHRSRGESHRDLVLIPGSAHGTNFATAAMAGYPARTVEGKPSGILILKADATGQIDAKHLESILAEHGNRVAGIMVTNPNTGGIFESGFKAISRRVHDAGGLVYMDGANMNAIAGWIDLDALGVDAVHQNTHKTWTIPHGGGGPGDALVAVSGKLVDFLPGLQVTREADGTFGVVRPRQSIGSFHRHWGNFAHKIRCYSYLLRLGREGIRRMSGVAVLSSRYLFRSLRDHYPSLPKGAAAVPRMHEFILSLDESDFQRIEASGTPKAQAIPRIGKLFLDYGYHAPTVAFPEPLGLMIEPTESFTRAELDRFTAAALEIRKIVREHPEALRYAPYFTPVDRVDEVTANRQLVTWEPLKELPPVHPNRVSPRELLEWPVEEVTAKILKAFQAAEKEFAP